LFSFGRESVIVATGPSVLNVTVDMSLQHTEVGERKREKMGRGRKKNAFVVVAAPAAPLLAAPQLLLAWRTT
jgi:hypothetical protein